MPHHSRYQPLASWFHLFCKCLKIAERSHALSQGELLKHQLTCFLRLGSILKHQIEHGNEIGPLQIGERMPQSLDQVNASLRSVKHEISQFRHYIPRPHSGAPKSGGSKRCTASARVFPKGFLLAGLPTREAAAAGRGSGCARVSTPRVMVSDPSVNRQVRG